MFFLLLYTRLRRFSGSSTALVVFEGKSALYICLFNEYIAFPSSSRIGGDVACSVDLRVFFTGLTHLYLNRGLLLLFFFEDLASVTFFGRGSLVGCLE